MTISIQLDESLAEIRRYLSQTPEALAIPGHDPGVWPSLNTVYG